MEYGHHGNIGPIHPSTISKAKQTISNVCKCVSVLRMINSRHRPLAVLTRPLTQALGNNSTVTVMYAPRDYTAVQ